MWERSCASEADRIAEEVMDELFRTINQLHYRNNSSKKQKQQIDDLEKILEQLQPKPKKKNKKETESNIKNTPELVFTPDSDKEDDRWLERQIELIKQPIYLVLNTREGLIKFSIEEYEKNKESYLSY